MQQLIKIAARFLKANDLIFNYKHRDLVKVEYVEIERNLKYQIENVHVSYGMEAVSVDNFKPDDEITILINTENLKITEPKEIGYR